MAPRFVKTLIERPFLPAILRKKFGISDQENAEAVANLSLRRFNYVGMMSFFLTLLGSAYFVMFYGFHMTPDDQFYSVIAMYLLLIGSGISSILFSFLYFKKVKKPSLCRWLSNLYFCLILTIMSLYFYAASLNTAKSDSFCPSFLYLLIFALFASPYWIDSYFFMVSGILSILLITGFGPAATSLMLQYALIGFIFFVGLVYLGSLSYLTQLKTIRLNQANDELAFLSTHDQLTGINNRHSLHTYLAENWARFVEENIPVAFVMFDVDSFKIYNDRLSHMQGDECLKAIVQAAKNAKLFAEENLYRFGGDEFLLVLPGLNEEETKRIGSHLVQTIYGAKLPSAPGSHYPFVSVSAGAYLGPIALDKTLDDYLAEADKQLYLSKKNGSNCFCFRDQKVE
jgi:diguanylate cyclase (GGDEF)-like protein